jgi:hypothetical protein
MVFICKVGISEQPFARNIKRTMLYSNYKTNDQGYYYINKEFVLLDLQASGFVAAVMLSEIVSRSTDMYFLSKCE